MTTLEMLAFGGIAYLALKDHGGGSAAGATYADAGTERVTSQTTTAVTDNKATNAGSTAVELANDGKIIATDVLDVIGSFQASFGDNSDSEDS